MERGWNQFARISIVLSLGVAASPCSPPFRIKTMYELPLMSDVNAGEVLKSHLLCSAGGKVWVLLVINIQQVISLEKPGL